jgi:hypothetical protein
VCLDVTPERYLAAGLLIHLTNVTRWGCTFISSVLCSLSWQSASYCVLTELIFSVVSWYRTILHDFSNASQSHTSVHEVNIS